MSAFDSQVGGAHYKQLKIQPTQYSMANGYDACSASIAKYIMRHEVKNGVQDLEKALHFVDLRLECEWPYDPRVSAINVMDLAESNGYELNGSKARALLDLAILFQASTRDGRIRGSDYLRKSIKALIEEYKAKTFPRVKSLVYGEIEAIGKVSDEGGLDVRA